MVVVPNLVRTEDVPIDQNLHDDRLPLIFKPELAEKLVLLVGNLLRRKKW